MKTMSPDPRPSVDTIYAPATPAGRGGVAVVRVSGPQAGEGLALLSGASLPSPRLAVLRTLTNPVSRETIDRALVLYFEGPASYTGEDVVEYHVHGGLAVVAALLDALAGLDGYRLAAPGEFTRRAFENGRMDLTTAEAVADLIDAQTAAQKAQALRQMGGALAALYEGWADRLTRALAHLEADLDFPDEDLSADGPGGVTESVRPALSVLRAEIAAHLADRGGERVREGIKIAVIGAPNAGKSSLVNALARREAAIVSDLPGTTRDIIEVHLDLGGYPVILADTAGLRPEQLGGTGHEAIEAEGIRRARACAQTADIRLLLFDGTTEPDAQTLALWNETAVVAMNKRDLEPRAREAAGVVPLSVKTGAGLDALLAALTAKIADLLGEAGRAETPSLTRRRHREALEEALAALDRAMEGRPLPELAAEDIRLAVRALGRITGRVDIDDLLDVIFRDFCIGK